MQIINKIILCFFLCLSLFSCKTDVNKDTTIEEIDTAENESIYIDPTITTGVIDKLDDGLKKDLKNYFGDVNDAFSDASFDFIGKKIDIFNMVVKDVYDNDFDLSLYKNGKVFIEIAATYCDHCGGQLKYAPKVKDCLKDIPFIQIFADKEGTSQNIDLFYLFHDEKMDDRITILQYDYDLMDILVSAGVSNTPTYLFIEDGVCKMSFSAFDEKYISKSIEAGFSDMFPRSRFVDKNGKPLESFYRTYHTLKNEINEESLSYLGTLHSNNQYLLTNLAGKKVSFSELSGDFDDGYIKKDSYDEFNGNKVVIFLLTREDPLDLERDIDYINEFTNSNSDIKALVVFLDDIEYFTFNTSSVYLKMDTKLTSCESVSSRSSIPVFLSELIYTYIYSDYAPVSIFIENNYITGISAGISSLMSIDKIKDMFFGDSCITLKKNLNQTY